MYVLRKRCACISIFRFNVSIVLCQSKVDYHSDRKMFADIAVKQSLQKLTILESRNELLASPSINHNKLLVYLIESYCRTLKTQKWLSLNIYQSTCYIIYLFKTLYSGLKHAQKTIIIRYGHYTSTKLAIASFFCVCVDHLRQSSPGLWIRTRIFFGIRIRIRNSHFSQIWKSIQGVCIYKQGKNTTLKIQLIENQEFRSTRI